MGKNKANKVHLVFDADKRREFLTGFRKRKLQRKKNAKDEFEKALKEERKRIKAESKESYKKLVASNRDIPELENLLEEEYEDDDATVKIITLSTENIAKQNNWIGENRPIYSTDHEDEEDDDDETIEEDDEVPGMELTEKIVKKEHTKKEKFDSEKTLKKKLKHLATKRVQKSKVFQMKNKLERQKQQKKSMKQRKFKEKTMNKTKRGGKKR
ncbi:nucleolar protein 12 [Coccinella septempunctata]|uniref:nucleolar protein 12 n=1 Tax=Coccinella septempunctata TaxID=41139 RepID=UPI001D06FB60|nr:nucleolar protein 12 [Coccinella septempunctata]